MKKCLLFLICICFILFFCKCPINDEYRWYLDNQTDDTLSVYLAFGFLSAYPDTILPIDPNKANISGADPHKKQLIWLSGGTPEKEIKILPKDTLSVFLMHHDTIKKYKWQEIRADYKILKRYDLSLNDLQILDFTIPYPPNKTMQDMKMYPPYDE